MYTVWLELLSFLSTAPLDSQTIIAFECEVSLLTLIGDVKVTEVYGLVAFWF